MSADPNKPARSRIGVRDVKAENRSLRSAHVPMRMSIDVAGPNATLIWAKRKQGANGVQMRSLFQPAQCTFGQNEPRPTPATLSLLARASVWVGRTKYNGSLSQLDPGSVSQTLAHPLTLGLCSVVGEPVDGGRECHTQERGREQGSRLGDV